MTPEELRLECLKLAVLQAKIENVPADLDRIALITTRFYNHITETPADRQKSRKPVADKVPEIFK